jgi:tetratricopeptide (TPR) repeat protein
MKQDKAWLEEAAAAENDFVRAVIFKPDHPAHASAREKALRARDMAGRALGQSHSSYGVALLNLAAYYEVIEKNAAESERHVRQALEVLGPDRWEQAEHFFWLGVYHFSEGNGYARASELWNAAADILRRSGARPQLLGDVLVSLSVCYFEQEPRKAAVVLQEALRIQRKQFGPAHETVRDTEARLAAAIRAVSNTR